MKKRLLILLVVLMVSCALVGTSFCEDKVKWSNGKVRQDTKYYKSGQKASVEYYREDGSPEQLESYDLNGNKLSVSYYGENGKLRTGAEGWAAIKWQYASGEMVSETYYGEDARPTERKLYNEEGDLVNKQYFGDPQLPAEEFNPYPTIAGETISFYDENGKPEGSSSFFQW